MQVDIVEPNKIFYIIKFMTSLILFAVVLLIFFPNVVNDSAGFKILFVIVILIGMLKLITESFRVIGTFQCGADCLKFVVRGKSTQADVSRIERMTVRINSYVGKSVGLSLRAHHGSDNKVTVVVGGQEDVFLVRLDSQQELELFERQIDQWISINRNIVVIKSLL